MAFFEFSIDESLLKEVERTACELSMTRSDFVRIALEFAIRNQRTIHLEQEHARGYAQHPIQCGEFDTWESEQVWNEK